jgi:hypothetical protein
MSTTISICMRFAKVDTCLVESGYDSNQVSDEIRRAALRVAVYRFGLSRVMYRLAAFCELSEVMASDLEYMKKLYPISLRAFGFSLKTDTWTRVTILFEAAGVYGMVYVLKHINNIISQMTSDSKNKNKMAWAQTIEYLVKDQVQKYGKMPVQLPASIRELMKDSLPPISLRSYGYNMDMDVEDRRKALLRAINMRGIHQVLDRLNKIAVYHKKDAFKSKTMNDDIEFCSNYISAAN